MTYPKKKIKKEVKKIKKRYMEPKKAELYPIISVFKHFVSQINNFKENILIYISEKMNHNKVIFL